VDRTVPRRSAPTAIETGKGGRTRKLWRLQRTIPAPAYWGIAAATILVLALGWSVLTYGRFVDPLFLPTPGAIVSRAIEMAQTGVLWSDAAASFYRVTVGFLISSAVAVPLGVLMGSYKVAEAAVEPTVGLIRYMPAVAFVPLTILWVGIGDGQKFLIIFIGTFFQQVLLVMDNVKRVPRDFINVGYTLGLSEGTILRKIVLPAAAPSIFDTLRITLGWAWTYLVVAELVAASTGLGHRIMEAQRYFQTDTILVGILVIGILGLVTDFAFKFAHGRLFAWTEQKR
jgi:NitT/TauT family transport system permease protein